MPYSYIVGGYNAVDCFWFRLFFACNLNLFYKPTLMKSSERIVELRKSRQNSGVAAITGYFGVTREWEKAIKQHSKHEH